MSVDQKKTAVEIVVASGGFTGDVLIEFQEQLFIPMSDMQQFRACYKCAIEYPTHLDIEPTDVGAEDERAANQQAAANPVEVPSSDELESNTNLERIIAGDNVSIVQVLNVFRLHPPGLTRSDIFANMIAYRETNHKSQRCNCSTLTTPSAYLDLEISRKMILYYETLHG